MYRSTINTRSAVFVPLLVQYQLSPTHDDLARDHTYAGLYNARINTEYVPILPLIALRNIGNDNIIIVHVFNLELKAKIKYKKIKSCVRLLSSNDG